MNDTFITVDNVYQVALMLVHVHISFIKNDLKKSLPIFVKELKKSIDLYEKPFTIDLENFRDDRILNYVEPLLMASNTIFDALNNHGKNLLMNQMKNMT